MQPLIGDQGLTNEYAIDQLVEVNSVWILVIS